MGKMLVTLSNPLEMKLRKIVREQYGNKRGSISIIVEKAVEKYLEDK